MVWIRNMFFEKNEAQFRPLWQAFVEAAEAWRYGEIQDESDFPNYMFVDECDLSYILISCLRSENEDLRKKIGFNNA